MEKYGYLYISLFLFIPWALIYFFNNNLRSRMIKAGLMAIPFGTLNLWYKEDYWNAPEVLFLYFISLDDILFAFVTTGISVTIFDVFFTEKQVEFGPKKYKQVFYFFCFIMVLFVILREVIGINSMFMFAIPIILSTIIILIKRKDLLVPSIITTILFSVLSIIVYIILFNYILPDFWNTYWYLIDTEIGWLIFGNVPVLEVLWYFSWGCLSAVLYDYGKGTKKIPNKYGKKLMR